MKPVLRLIIIISVLLLTLFLVDKGISYFFETKQLYTELLGKKQELERISKKAALLEIEYKNQSDLLEKLQKDWKDEQSKLNGRIKILSDATYIIREKARKENNSDIIFNGKSNSYVMNEIRFNNGPPIGYVLIFSDGRVVSKVYNHEIDVKLAVLRDMKTGRYHIASKANFILKSGSLKKDGINWFNKEFPLTIKGGSAIIDPVEEFKDKSKRLFTWPPKANIGINIYTKKVNPSLGVSFLGYGSSPKDLDFKFLSTGVEYDNDEGLSIDFKPVLYRPFNNALPNTYIGPGVSTDGTNTKYFIGINVGF